MTLFPHLEKNNLYPVILMMVLKVLEENSNTSQMKS